MGFARSANCVTTLTVSSNRSQARYVSVGPVTSAVG